MTMTHNPGGHTRLTMYRHGNLYEESSDEFHRWRSSRYKRASTFRFISDQRSKKDKLKGRIDWLSQLPLRPIRTRFSVIHPRRSDGKQ